MAWAMQNQRDGGRLVVLDGIVGSRETLASLALGGRCGFPGLGRLGVGVAGGAAAFAPDFGSMRSEEGLATNLFSARTTLQPGEGSEGQALVLLEKVRRYLALPAESFSEFRLAVVEACLNALEHGAPPVEVEVAAERVAQGWRVVVCVIDHGQGFSPASVPQPELPAKLASGRKRGWGLEIMRRFADEVTFNSRPGLTQVRLVRLLREV